MVIDIVSPADALRSARRTLGLTDEASPLLDDALLAAALRRAASSLSPCSRATVLRAVAETLQPLAAATADIEERLDAVLEDMVVVGDLLELPSVASGQGDAKDMWVFPAPPSFVMRPTGKAYVLGIAPDEASALPSALAERVIHDRVVRTIEPEPNEDLRGVLAEVGLHEITEAAWLKAPKSTSSAEYVRAMTGRLSGAGPSGDVADLKVLDPTTSVLFYKGRWVVPGKRTGVFVARRPQAYRADLWGYAELRDGEVQRFVDLPLSGSRWRGCDVAWLLQMAIDAERGTPQRYGVVRGDGLARFDFYSPLPLWAQRRLQLVGRREAAERALMAFSVANEDAETEEGVLRDTLWLARQSGEGADQ